MSKMPKMNLWIDAFNSDTSFLTDEELGVYFRLIFYAWGKEGYLPNDYEFILNLTRNKNEKAMMKILSLYWNEDEKGFYQKRLVEEYERAISITETNRQNANKRYAVAEQPQSDRTASISKSTSISKSKIDIIFDKFWEKICYKVSKGQARRTYLKLPEQWSLKPEQLAELYNKYYDALKDKQYAQYPSTWLNAEGYLNIGLDKKELSDEEIKEWKWKSDLDMRKKGLKPLSWSVGYIRELDEAIANGET